MEGAETLKSLWQQKAGPEPVDLFESAVKHRAGGYTAQRARKRERRGRASGGVHDRKRGEKMKAEGKGNRVHCKLNGDRP